MPVLALASATICFSRFSQKSRFSWHNLSTLMTAKMHENFNRVSYLRYKHPVKNERNSLMKKELCEVKNSQNCGVCVKKGTIHNIYIPSL